MTERKPSAVRAVDLPARTGSIYPPLYAKALAGREKRSMGDVFGLTQFGVNLTTLAPGSSSAQRHWHEEEDEFIYVVDGELVLVDNDGEHLLTPGMCAGFKAGVANGHKLVNRSARPATIVEVGTRAATERAHYTDADVDMAAHKVDGRFVITRKDGTPY